MTREMNVNWFGNTKGYKTQATRTDATKKWRRVGLKVSLEKVWVEQYDEIDLSNKPATIKIDVDRTQDEDADIKTAEALLHKRLRYEFKITHLPKTPRG